MNPNIRLSTRLLLIVISVLCLTVLIFAYPPLTGQLKASQLAQPTPVPTITIDDSSPNDDFLDPITPSNLNKVRLVSLTDLGNLQNLSNEIQDIFLSPDGRYFTARGFRDQSSTLTIREVTTNNIIHQFSDPDLKYLVLQFSPDGKYLAVGNMKIDFQQDDTVDIWDIAAEKKVFSSPIRVLQSLTFSSDGRLIAAVGCNDKRFGGGCYGGAALVWDIANRKKLLELKDSDLPEGRIKLMRSVAFSPDGQMIATGSCNLKINSNVHKKETCRRGEISLWRVANGEKLNSLLGSGDVVTSLMFSPDGKQLASGSCYHKADDKSPECKSGEITLWDVASWQPAKPLIGDKDTIDKLVFNQDSTLLAASSDAGNANIWDIAQKKVRFTKSGLIDTIGFTPNGNKFIAVSNRYISNRYITNRYIYVFGVVRSGIEVKREGVLVIGNSDLVPSTWIAPKESLPRHLIEITNTSITLNTCLYTNGSARKILRSDIVVKVTDLQTNRVTATRKFTGQAASCPPTAGANQFAPITTQPPDDKIVAQWIAGLRLH
jgi:WD40 repeat protein